jgi:predicted CXXCH cytochrome family protein
MAAKMIALIIGFIAATIVVVSGNGAGPNAGTRQTTDGYAWANACKDCHSDIYAHWEKSKHGRAFSRLRGEKQNDTACVNCHITGKSGKVEVGGKLQNAGVQCESCHGPSAAHVANPMDKPPTRLPGPSVCLGCHNSQSPHYRGFVYDGMLRFGGHPITK